MCNWWFHKQSWPCQQQIREPPPRKSMWICIASGKSPRPRPRLLRFLAHTERDRGSERESEMHVARYWLQQLLAFTGVTHDIMSPADSSSWKQTVSFLGKLSLTGCSLSFLTLSVCLSLSHCALFILPFTTVKLGDESGLNYADREIKAAPHKTSGTVKNMASRHVGENKSSGGMNEKKCVTETLVEGHVQLQHLTWTVNTSHQYGFTWLLWAFMRHWDPRSSSAFIYFKLILYSSPTNHIT